MKDLKRAYRRYQKEVHFKRRAKNVFSWMGHSNANHEQYLSWADYWGKIKSGERATWLRTTGRPCDCCMCTEFDKYKRPAKSEISKLINEEIMDSITDELNRLKGKTKPFAHSCIIARCDDGCTYFVDSNPKIESDFYSGIELEDMITQKSDNFPKETGIYKCVLFIHSYPSLGHPEDPAEWDVSVWIEDVKKIDIPL